MQQKVNEAQRRVAQSQAQPYSMPVYTRHLGPRPDGVYAPCVYCGENVRTVVMHDNTPMCWFCFAEHTTYAEHPPVQYVGVLTRKVTV